MHQARIPDWATERGRELNHFPVIDLRRTALIVVDMQNAFMTEGQPMANPIALSIIPNVNRTAAAVRRAGGRVVWLRHTITEDGPYAEATWQKLAWGGESAIKQALTRGNFGHALHPDMATEPGDLVIDKHRYSAFNRKSSNLDEVLQGLGIDTLIVTGTMTNVCCESTARDGHMLDYKVLFVSDATAAPTDEEHNAALLNLTTFFAHVCDTAEILRIVGSTLPVIDLSPLDAPGADGRRVVAGHIRRACLDNGFFYIVGHGIPPELTEAVLAESRRLFGLDTDAKQAIAASSPSGRGYARMGGRTLSGGRHPPVKEEYYLGRDCPGEDNRWPGDLPGFREALQAYVEAMLGLASRLIGAIALSLDLPEDHFAGFCEQPIAALRLVRYPPEGAEAGAHTDFGALTLLLQDEAGGLEVFDRATGGWIRAAPIPGSFVVNLGDLFERWTNGLYRSTPHRVVHPPGTERFSAPFFFTGAADYPVVCLPSCLKPGEQPAYPPTTPAGHLRERSLQQGF